MPLQRRTKIGSIIALAILVASGALMGLGPVVMNSVQPSIEPRDSDLSTTVLNVNDTNLASTLNNNPFFVLDFFYPGSSSSKVMDKTISDLSDELEGQIAFGKISGKANGNTVAKYKIQSYPTLLLFNDGLLLNRINGNISKSDLVADLKELKPGLNTSKVQLNTVSALGLPSIALPMTRLGENKPSKPMPISDKDMNSTIERYPFLVVDASTTWCEWCGAMNVTVRDLANELQGKVAFGLIDMDHNDVTKTEYNITNYPTMLIFKDGKLADKVVGFQKKSSFLAKLEQIDPQLI